MPDDPTQNQNDPAKAISSPSTGRIKGKPPLFEDVLLACYSTGLFNGGGCSFSGKRSGSTRRYPIINVDMCDRDALEPVGKWWAVEVTPKAGRAKVCVQGPAYRIQASGLRAELIMSEMMKCGLSSRKVKQWRKVLSLCSESAESCRGSSAC